jgi:hypothetical protein
VARLTGQIKQVVLPLNQVAHPVLISHVGNVHPDFVFDASNVERIAAVL